MLFLYSVSDDWTLCVPFSPNVCLLLLKWGVFVNGNDILNPKLLAKTLDRQILNTPGAFSFNFQITFCSYSSYAMSNVSLKPCLT